MLEEGFCSVSFYASSTFTLLIDVGPCTFLSLGAQVSVCKRFSVSRFWKINKRQQLRLTSATAAWCKERWGHGEGGLASPPIPGFGGGQPLPVRAEVGWEGAGPLCPPAARYGAASDQSGGSARFSNALPHFRGWKMSPRALRGATARRVPFPSARSSRLLRSSGRTLSILLGHCLVTNQDGFHRAAVVEWWGCESWWRITSEGEASWSLVSCSVWVPTELCGKSRIRVPWDHAVTSLDLKRYIRSLSFWQRGWFLKALLGFSTKISFSLTVSPPGSFSKLPCWAWQPKLPFWGSRPRQPPTSGGCSRLFWPASAREPLALRGGGHGLGDKRGGAGAAGFAAPRRRRLLFLGAGGRSGEQSLWRGQRQV